MTDGDSGTPPRTSRRAFLAAAATAGTVALTGCGGFGPFAEGEEPATIDGAALRDAVSGDVPSVPESLPVAVERAYVDRRATNVRETLSAVPTPLEAERVPNGLIRTELSEMREEARTALDDAAAASSPVEALASLRRASEEATAASAGWRAVEGAFGFDDLFETASAVRRDVDDFRGRWRYAGDDPIRAVLTHAAVENRVAAAGRRLSGALETTRYRSENPISVGEAAGAVGRARASLADGAHVFERFASSLNGERSMRPVFRAAGESLTVTLNDRREALPDADAEPSSYADAAVEGTAVGHALSELREAVSYGDGIDDERATGQRANVVLSAFWTLVRVRAFDRLRERVDDGDYVTVESAADVRELRAAAVRAIERASATGEHPRLDRHVLQLVEWLDGVESQVARHDEEEVPVRWITRDLARYPIVEAMARETPATSADVADALRAAK